MVDRKGCAAQATKRLRSPLQPRNQASLKCAEATRLISGPTRQHIKSRAEGFRPVNVSAVIAAAGRGSRAKAHGTPPKQYVQIGGRSILSHAISALADAEEIDQVLVIIHEADQDIYTDTLKRDGAPEKLLHPVLGGATRQESVFAGLSRLASESPPDAVLIHDGARPFLPSAVITRVTEALQTMSAAIAAVPLADTLQRADASGLIRETLNRDGLWRAQTPQGFAFKPLLQAHRKAADAGRDDFTDDAALFTWAGGNVHVVEGAEQNHKITTPKDLAMAENMVSKNANETMAGPDLQIRTGSGFDVHRAASGDHVWLCGIKVAAPFSLSGHSDADVALHALTDAILGALGDGDIGSHFPPSDPQWKDAASHIFLAHAAQRVLEHGGAISNVDITVICESPKIGPHRDAMRTEVARILDLALDRVSVKATTTEGLGFTGRGEGIAAMASATLRLPSP